MGKARLPTGPSKSPLKSDKTRNKGRFITFPETIDLWLENEYERRGHRHVNELVIDIVRRAWEPNQETGKEPEQAVA